jgi:hypothetical protein
MSLLKCILHPSRDLTYIGTAAPINFATPPSKNIYFEISLSRLCTLSTIPNQRKAMSHNTRGVSLSPSSLGVSLSHTSRSHRSEGAKPAAKQQSPPSEKKKPIPHKQSLMVTLAMPKSSCTAGHEYRERERLNSIPKFDLSTTEIDDTFLLPSVGYVCETRNLSIHERSTLERDELSFTQTACSIRDQV